MLQIALCDDDKKQLEILESLLEEYRLQHEDHFVLSPFSSGKKFLSYIENDHCPHIVFLDVVMPEINGIQLAKKIQTMSPDTKVVFLSSSKDFAVDSYEVGAAYYALKPITKEKLFSLLDRLIENIQKEMKKVLVVRKNDKIIKIDLHKVEFCEASGHNVLLHMTDGSVMDVNLTMTQLESALVIHPGFVKVHRSFMVNMDLIHFLTLWEVAIMSGKSVPISRGKGAKLKDTYLTYCFQTHPQD